ncbi:MAG: EamA family transporter [Bacteroidales bacterium]|nr:EamA family transporter [Bacteroidales bacterium]
MKKERTVLGHLSAFLAYLIFGINIIVNRDLAGCGISPLALFTFRSLGAGAMFWILSAFYPAERVEKKDYPKIFLAAVLGFFICQLTFLYGISHITPMDCSIVTSLSPIYTMFIAAVAIKEPITWKKGLGVVISLAGFIFLILNSVSSSSGAEATQPVGIVLMIFNSLSFSLYLGIFKPLISKYSVVTFMKWIFLFTTLMSLPFTAKEIVTFDYLSLTSSYIWELVFLILCATFITYFLIPVAQKNIRPTLISMYSYVQPIMAIVISICVGMDTLTWQKVLAAITVFGGVIIVNYSRSRTR